MKKRKDTVKEDIEHWFGDRDKDGVINLLDCDPSDTDKHGWFGDAVGAVKRRVVSPIYRRVRSFKIGRPAEYVRELKRGVREGYKTSKTGEVHPLEDIRKGERLYHERIVTPVSAFMGGKKARREVELQKQVEQKAQEAETAGREFETKWKPYIKNNEFVGIEQQYERYKTGYSHLESKYKEYESVQHELEQVGKPSPWRQLPRGAAELAVSIPGFVVFGAPRIIAETAISPKKAPAKAVKFGREYYAFGRKEPFRATGQIAAMVVGGKALRAVKTKAVEGVKFYGKTKIPVEQIVKPEVISGTTRFPVSRAAPRKLIETFEKGEYTKLQSQQLAKIASEEAAAVKVWHAAPKEFGKAGEIAIGKSELPGLYTAPSLSPYFLRITAKPRYKLFGLGLEKAPKPSALLIKTKGIERLPKGIREKGFKGARKFMLEKAEPGRAFITPKYERGWKVTPREQEAVIAPQTKLVRTEFTKFVEWEGKKIPIHEYAVEGLKGVTRDVKGFEKAGEVSRRYGKEYERYGIYREPIITPKGLARPVFLSEVIEEDMRRIPKEERVFAPFKKEEGRPPIKVEREERRQPPERRREWRPVPPEEGRWIPPAEERILEPFEDPIKEYPFEEPPFISEEEWLPPPERPFKELPYKLIEIIPYETTPPIPKKKTKAKKHLKTIEEELDSIYRKRRYGTLSPSEMLRM